MITEESDKATNGQTILPVEISEDSTYKGWGYRHQQCFILFCGITTAYSMRVYMSVSLVAMTDSAFTNAANNLLVNRSSILATQNVTFDSVNSTYGYHENVSDSLFVPPYPKFKWDKKTQDFILSSFFWGYMMLQIPAGHFVHYLGARYLLCMGLFINSIISILLPFAAYYGGWKLMMAGRITQGLGQSFILPSVHTFLGKWAPLEERGRLSALVLGGQAIGTVMGLPMTGFIASSRFGWPGIFYCYGIFCAIIGGLILWLIADTPAKHRSISAAERHYIEEKLGQTGSKKHRRVPWAKILRCRGLYANIIAHIGTTWGQLTLYSEVPAYMARIMGVNIKANGLLSALPFFVMWFTNFFFSWLADMLIVKKCLNVTNSRKFANTLGSIPPCIGLIALAYAPRDIYVVEIILIFICSFKTATHVGFFVNHIDISPNYSGTMLSVSNFASNLIGSAAPLVAGFILTDVADIFLWRKVFFVSAGMYFFTNLVYVVLGSSEKAEWDDPQVEGEDDRQKDLKGEEAKQLML